MDKGYAERHWESKIAEFVCIRCSTLNHSIFFAFVSGKKVVCSL